MQPLKRILYTFWEKVLQKHYTLYFLGKTYFLGKSIAKTLYFFLKSIANIYIYIYTQYYAPDRWSHLYMTLA